MTGVQTCALPICLSATENDWNDNIYAFADSEMLQKVTGVHDVYIINGTSGNFNVQGLKLSGVYSGKDVEDSSEPDGDDSSEPAPDTSADTSADDEESRLPEDNPDTGVALPAAVVLLAAVTGAAVAVTRRKK